MWKNNHWCKLVCSLVVSTMLLMTIACSTKNTQPPEKLIYGWLTKNVTTREQVLKALGEPARYYQQGLIMAYRIDVDSNGNERWSRGVLGDVEYNVILVFNQDGVLITKKRIRLKDA